MTVALSDRPPAVATTVLLNCPVVVPAVNIAPRSDRAAAGYNSPCGRDWHNDARGVPADRHERLGAVDRKGRRIR